LILFAALIGGLMHAPSNYDALSYRTPQLLHWLDQGGWHWIETPNSRMNIASPGFNWLTAPFIILLHTDRISFVVNVVAFALFPGLLFELFWRAGVRKRVAWWWMWLLPSSYVFATQAGGIGNDLTGTVYATAAITFALRARAKRSFEDAAISLIAAAICTGIKNTNLPIILPWAMALGSAGWRALADKPVKSASLALLAALVSCVPTIILNVRQTGHWTGDPSDEHRVRQPNLWVGAVSNSVVLAVANLQPPLVPASQRINEVIAQSIDALGLSDLCRQSPRFVARWYEMPSEESAGVGPGIPILAGVGVLASLFTHRCRFKFQLHRQKLWPVGLAGLFSLLVPICFMSSEGIPRLIAPFVSAALSLGLFLIDESLVRIRLWRAAALVAAALPLPALVFSPSRPLFPQSFVLNRIRNSEGKNDMFDRIRRVYSVYATRADAFATVRDLLPKGTKEIGLIALGDEPETSLWRPFGSLSVRHLSQISGVPSDMVIVASDETLRYRFGISVADFSRIQGLNILGSRELLLRASGVAGTWYVMAPRR
jgi:hypothetical protein